MLINFRTMPFSRKAALLPGQRVKLRNKPTIALQRPQLRGGHCVVDGVITCEDQVKTLRGIAKINTKIYSGCIKREPKLPYFYKKFHSSKANKTLKEGRRVYGTIKNSENDKTLKIIGLISSHRYGYLHKITE